MSVAYQLLRNAMSRFAFELVRFASVIQTAFLVRTVLAVSVLAVRHDVSTIVLACSMKRSFSLI